ncbi:Hpt domain-containing protein [Heterostelium album PN500]|uniref:Hpt domain-containing protein n=1 Tax=Heterostelium pallidum (strain ATCC 26659 / Pp 5 / PN500) TaxID=670386 RepID=D3BNK6_HETP5|nr:Hpt domain-containing protein [Heterostelium album PN500]EFA76957.1 Hpt domain-containing protein [Heterostelium album PN500]|eukprot:XP_020429089.1 Hpt domain-containing protein [Heterostelium album PN500]
MNTDYTGPTPTERFQQRVLADYSEGDHEFEAELINSYKVSVEEHLPQLDKSLATLDEKESILHSHDIKGSSSYIGAEAVRFVSGKIESLCKEKQLEKAAEHLDELKKEVTELFKLLDKYMASWNGGESVGETAAEAAEDEKVAEKHQHQQEKSKEDKKDTSSTTHQPPPAAADSRHHPEASASSHSNTSTASATTATVTSVVVEEKHNDKTTVTASNSKPNTTTSSDSHHNHHHTTTNTSSKPTATTTTTYTVTATNSSSSSNTHPTDKKTEKVTTHILEEPKKGTPKN